MLSQESCWIEQYIHMNQTEVKIDSEGDFIYWNYQRLPISGKMHLPDLLQKWSSLSPCGRKDLHRSRPSEMYYSFALGLTEKIPVHSFFPRGRLGSFPTFLSSARIRSPPDWRPLPQKKILNLFSWIFFGTMYVTCERQSMIAFSQPHNQFSDLAGLKIYISMIISSVDLNRGGLSFILCLTYHGTREAFEDDISKRIYIYW